jgi:ABC-2 type transport system ATP-binding protein
LSNNEYIIETQGLVKVFDKKVRAVDGLNIKVRRGEVFGFLGTNGAGKTTSIRMMVGLLKPTKGKTIIDGEVIKAGSKVVKEKVGVCPQEITIWDKLTTYENLRMIGDLYDVPKSKLESQINLLLGNLQLEEKRNAKASALSGGMKRRLNLAMALVHDPEIVVLDEPSPGLDPQSRLVLWDFIQNIPKKGEKTVILTTHFMEEADRLSNMVAIIDHGKLLVNDTPENLKASIGEGDVLVLAFEEGADLESAANDFKIRKDVMAATATGDKVILHMKDAMRKLPEIFKFVSEHGSHIQDIKYRGTTLEDVFVSLTGRGLRE